MSEYPSDFAFAPAVKSIQSEKGLEWYSCSQNLHAFSLTPLPLQAGQILKIAVRHVGELPSRPMNPEFVQDRTGSLAPPSPAARRRIPFGDGGKERISWASELSVTLDNLSSNAISTVIHRVLMSSNGVKC